MKRAERQSNAFTDLLKRLVRVPKHEIDEQERKEVRKSKARKTHKAYAKPGQIVTDQEPHHG